MGGVVNKWEEDFEFMVKIKNLTKKAYDFIETIIENSSIKKEEFSNRITNSKKFKSSSEMVNLLFEYLKKDSIKNEYNLNRIGMADDPDVIYITFSHKEKLLRVPLIFYFSIDFHENTIKYEIWINTYVTKEINKE